MPISTARQLVVLGAAACVPLALGIAMHLEHLATQRACLADACTAAAVTVPDEPVVIAVPTPVMVQPDAAPEDLRGAYDFAFVANLPTPHIVLTSEADVGEAAFEALAMGGPRYRGTPGDDRFDHPVWRDVDASRLPERARLAIGRDVHVYSASGRVCTARIGQPTLVSEMSGTIEYFAQYDYSADDDDEAIEIHEPAIADPASIWSAGRRLVVAPLEGDGCDDALWVRDVALAEPLVYVPRIVEVSADLPSPAARRMVQRSAALRPIAAAFAEHAAQLDDDGPGLFDRLEGQTWLEPRRATELAVFAAVGEEFGGCGGYDAAWAAIAVDGEGSPVAPVWADAKTDWIEAVFDLDADGTPEVLAQTRLGTLRVYRLGEALRELAMLGEVPAYGCPC